MGKWVIGDWINHKILEIRLAKLVKLARPVRRILGGLTL